MRGYRAQPDPSGREGVRGYLYCPDEQIGCTEHSGPGVVPWHPGGWAVRAGANHPVTGEAGMNRSNQATIRVLRSMTAGN